jgi:hypothetical protein
VCFQTHRVIARHKVNGTVNTGRSVTVSPNLTVVKVSILTVYIVSSVGVVAQQLRQYWISKDHLNPLFNGEKPNELDRHPPVGSRAPPQGGITKSTTYVVLVYTLGELTAFDIRAHRDPLTPQLDLW